MKQQDLVEQRFHSDAVSFGGWSLDLHPADGVFSEVDGCTQLHAKGLFLHILSLRFKSDRDDRCLSNPILIHGLRRNPQLDVRWSNTISNSRRIRINASDGYLRCQLERPRCCSSHVQEIGR